MITRRAFGAGIAGGLAASSLAVGCSRRDAHAKAAAELRALPRPEDPADLVTLVRYSTLAANGHNTQPWRFRRSGSGVRIEADPGRRTPVVDPDDHHLFASLGCAAENLMLAATAAGSAAEARFADDAVEIDIAGRGMAADPLVDAIPARQSTRAEYDGRAIPAADLRALAAVAAVPGCEIVVIADRPRLDELLGFIVAGNDRQIADPAFIAELLAWLRFSTGKALATGDGLYARCAGFPALPEWLGRRVFPRVLHPGAEADRLAKQVRSSGALVVFVSEADDPAHWVAAGRACQRFALAATRRGLRHAFLNQPVEVAELRRDLARWLGTTARPDLVLRLGHGRAMPRSLRRPIGAVIA